MSLVTRTRTFFAPGGPLSRAVKGYEERPPQVRMAEAVAQALCDGGFLIAEAGTGTGKTLAYIIPAVLSGRKVIVSTATRHLQEQVAQSDAALVARALKAAPAEGGSARFKTVLLKGRANYLCRRKLAMFPVLGAAGAEKTVLEWAATTGTGDRAGCAGVPENDPVWPGFVSDHEGCLGHRCRFQKKCFVEAAKAVAAEAEIVVANHHLFFADLVIRSGSEGGVLPEYDTVVFDEAHAVEDVAAAHFGKSAGSVELDLLLKAASGLRRGKGKGGARLHEAAPRVRAAGAEFFAALGAVEGQAPRQGLGQARRFDSASIPRGATQALMQLDNALDSLSAAVRAIAESNDPPAEAERVLARTSEFRNALAFIVEARAPGYVFYFETTPQHAGPPRVTLTAFPLDIGGILNTVLYPTLKTAVFTSATLSTGGNLAYMADRLGLGSVASGQSPVAHDKRPTTNDERQTSRDSRPAANHSALRTPHSASRPPHSALSTPHSTVASLVLPAPFDYASQACLYVPDGLPEPNDARFTREAVAQIDRLCAITAGRAFVLCTSRRQMDAYHEALRHKLPYDVFRQGDLPKTEILDRYRGGRPGVLFATASFWEGVDVPGEALSLVIMDRIPFSPPDEPTTQARIEKLREAGRDPWNEFQLPQATLALKQGFGRLIRTRTDRGIVAVLDTRLLAKGYGKYILGSLPRLSVFTDTAQVRKWWDAGRRS
jgi:ATP-dependent DNA helicase DinG